MALSKKQKMKEPKKKARMHPFTRALQFAEKRLAKALEEQQKASEKLSKLSAEIPDLQRKIAALNGQESNVGRLRDITPTAEQRIAKEFYQPPQPRDRELLGDLTPPVQTAEAEPDFLAEVDAKIKNMTAK
jgi:predicted  nucleic acid-binding Zn-ribbon protein